MAISQAKSNGQVRVEETKLLGDDKFSVDELGRKLGEALSLRYELSSTISHEGNKLNVPQGMSIPQAIDALKKFHQQREETFKVQLEFKCHPNDGLYNFTEAVKGIFGSLIGTTSFGFFGPEPGHEMTVQIAYDKTVVLPVGTSEIPGLPIEMNIVPEEDHDSPVGGSLYVIFTCARKYEPLIRDIEKETRERLKKNSIFRGKAIDSGWNYLDLSGFSMDKVVYSAEVWRQIEAEILSPIRHTKIWRKNKSSLKRGILLSGKYGVGKSMTARALASECEAHGWTFINVRPDDDIVRVLNSSKLLQPCLVFCEDIDQVVSGGERDGDLNEILNTIDGIVSKNDEVMTVLTTNHPEKINQAMFRPGRLDKAIFFGDLDEAAIEKLIRLNLIDEEGRSMVYGKLDMKRIAEAAAGYPPAFIVGAVTGAKAYAITYGNQQNNGALLVTSENIEFALQDLRAQFKMMEGTPVESPLPLDSVLSRLVDERVKEATAPIMTYLENRFGKR
jgi:hypothetical protein